MKTHNWVCAVALLAAAGCSFKATSSKRDLDKTVRAVIAAQMKVDPAAIDMNKPISAAPLRADDLDLIEIVMALEDRLNIDLPDSAFDKYGGLDNNGGPVRITPANLVTIVRAALARESPGKRRRS